MYLLDTDILSHVLRRSPPLHLIARIADTPSEAQFTSAITLGELYYGAYRLGRDASGLLLRLDQLLADGRVVLPFDEAAARRYGELRADLERRGTPLGDADLRIASIALNRGLAVVTGNLRHFQRVPGLTVENWLAT
ncbi:MAG: PIN domain-containing protein [Chloroflexi bacterium]|nr:PIN domain-containing protein [Chloroflexota bacterium]